MMPEFSNEFQDRIDPYRRELLVHCYRFLGSLEDAEDALQETWLRAWRHLDTLKEQTALRSWLYKISTRVCLDLLDVRKARTALAYKKVPSDPRAPLPAPILEPVWLEPLPEEYLDGQTSSPEARYEIHESVALAFLVVLQQLPGRQRAVLILCDVLGWKAREAAAALGLSIAAVNSALQRARTTLKEQPAYAPLSMPVQPQDTQVAALLDRYVQVWETANSAELVHLLREDSVLTMPPLPAWYRGRSAIQEFLNTHLFAGSEVGRYRLVKTRANGSPALAVYQRDPAGVYRPAVLQVLTLHEDRIARVDCFLVSEERLFSRFQLPLSILPMSS
jgi:RNA polymerase sigma-70 factor, ECF subfamily